MTTHTILAPMPDPELVGSPFDLSRPEFGPLMERYVSRRGRRHGHLLGPLATALIVNRAGIDEEPLKESLEAEGWFVKSCPGPAKTQCAILRGEPCPVRESVDVAVVYVDQKAMWPGSGMLPRLRCASDSASPGVIALEGSFEAPRFGRGKATVGALRAPEVVIDLIDELCSGSHS